MANSNTEHSKALRAKTAAEWNKKQKELGLRKTVAFNLTTETANELNAILAELGGKKAEAIAKLCAFYRQHQ